MTGWNYRLTREQLPDGLGGKSDVFAIREVYYDEAGNPTSWSRAPITPSGESWREAVEDLTLMGVALGAPILDLTLDPPRFVDHHEFMEAS